MQRLGLLGPDENLLDIVVGMMRDMVAGFYDPRTGNLFLIEGPVGEGMKPTLIHELTHALDDQHYDLDGIEEAYEDDPDRQFAGRCLFEGCAVHAQHLFELANPDVAYTSLKQQADDEGLAEGQERVMREVPAFLLLGTLLHYRVGPALVGRFVGDAFPEGMKRLWAAPPTTQEQFLHPDRWMDPARRDLPRQVVLPEGLAAVLGEGWTTYYEHTLGELDFALGLDFFVGGKRGRVDMARVGTGRLVADDAYRAASGWDAGRTLYLDHGGEGLVVVNALCFDSAQDATEAMDVMIQAERAKGIRVGAAQDRQDGLATATYGTLWGSGWIARRGAEVLQADGVPPARLEDFTAALLGTRFVQDPEDRGDVGTEGAPADPFAGCAIVDARRGLGLRPLPQGWQAAAAEGEGAHLAVVRGPGGTMIQVLVADQGMTRGALPFLLESQIPGFDGAQLQDARVAGHAGYGYPIMKAPRFVQMRAASDGIRTYVAVVMGAPDEVAAQAATIDTILAGIVSVPSY